MPLKSFWGFLVCLGISVVCQGQSRGGRDSDLSVLILGDSHFVGAPGAVLDRELKVVTQGQSASYAILGAGGSSPYSWTEDLNPKKQPGVPTKDPNWFATWGTWTSLLDFVKKPDTLFLTFENFLGAHLPVESRPDLVVVSFGSNMAKYFALPGSGKPDNIEGAKQEIRFMIDLLECTQVKWAWIGPPQVRDEKSIPIYKLSQAQITNFNKLLAHLLHTTPANGFVEFLDSTGFIADSGDGLHFKACPAQGACAARNWGEAMGSTIRKWMGL